MRKPEIKIYGERNTGTNYLSRLIALNLDARLVPGEAPPVLIGAARRLSMAAGLAGIPERGRFNRMHMGPLCETVLDVWFALTERSNWGWKHAAPAPVWRAGRRAKPDLCVTLTKNPYSWLLSLYRRPYHSQYNPEAGMVPFEEFLANPLRTRRREHIGGSAAPGELWNRKNASYLELRSMAPVLNAKYEDLLDDPPAVAGTVADALGLPTRSGFVNLRESAKQDLGKNYDYYRDYYLNERWRREWSNESLDIVNRQLDPALMAHFGYGAVAPRSA